MKAKGIVPLTTTIKRRLEACFSSPLIAKIAGGILWLSLGAIPSRVASLLSTFLVVRILGKSAYGEFSLVRSTASAFVVVAMFGMGRAAAKCVSEYLVVDKERAGRVVALNYLFTLLASGLVALFFYLAAPVLCERTLDAPQLAFQVRIGALLLVALAFVGAQTGTLTGFQAYGEISLASAISGFLSIPFFVLGAKYWGTTGAILGFSTNALFNALINGFYISILLKRRQMRYQFRNCWRELSILWNYSLPSTLLSLVSSMTTWGTSILIARRVNGFAELGIFDASRQIQTAILYLPVLASNVLVPTLSELNARRDNALHAKTTRYNVAINAGFTALIALGVAICSPWIMRGFGDGFEGRGSVLLTLLLACVAMSVVNAYGTALTSLGALWGRFWLTVMWGTIVVLLLLVFSARFSAAFAASLAILIAYSIQALGSAFYVRRLLTRIDRSNSVQVLRERRGS